MKRAIETFMYGLCWRGDWITRLVGPIWFRWYCPHPVRSDWSARVCIAAGDCGCDNNPPVITRLRNALHEVTTNGEWIEGEQCGDWKISKEVYETARDALTPATMGDRRNG
jgi:hypothetical protein